MSKGLERKPEHYTYTTTEDKTMNTTENTTHKLSEETKRDLVERIAEQWTEAQSVGDLARFYQDTQEQFLSDMTDAELLDMAKDSGIEL